MATVQLRQGCPARTFRLAAAHECELQKWFVRNDDADDTGSVVDSECRRASGKPGQAAPVVDEHLARRLVDGQFPQWADLPIEPVELSGIDNRTFRLGEQLTVRLPSALGYALQVDKEQRWLPLLAAHLPLPIPTPVTRGCLLYTSDAADE